MIYLAKNLSIAWWIFPWRTVSHNQMVNIEIMDGDVFDGKIPSTKMEKWGYPHLTLESRSYHDGRVGKSG